MQPDRRRIRPIILSNTVFISLLFFGIMSIPMDIQLILEENLLKAAALPYSPIHWEGRNGTSGRALQLSH